MKKILLTTLFLFSNCSTAKTNSNEIKIASFNPVFQNKNKKMLEEKYNIKISYIKLNYKINFFEQIAKYNPSIIIAPSYLNKKIIKKQKNTENKKVYALNDITKSVNSLSTLIFPPELKNNFLPLYLSDLKIFSNIQELIQKKSMSLKELLKIKKINIVVEDNPRIISWVANYLESKDFLKPAIIANINEKILKKNLNAILQKENISFMSQEDALHNWKDIDVFIGQNWVQNQLKQKEDYKNSIKVENANLIQLYSLITTNNKNEKEEQVIHWIINNYQQTLFSTLFNPVTNKESQNQYNIIDPDFRKDMILSKEENYYYFTKDNYNDQILYKMLGKKFL